MKPELGGAISRKSVLFPAVVFFLSIIALLMPGPPGNTKRSSGNLLWQQAMTGRASAADDQLIIEPNPLNLNVGAARQVKVFLNVPGGTYDLTVTPKTRVVGIGDIKPSSAGAQLGKLADGWSIKNIQWTSPTSAV